MRNLNFIIVMILLLNQFFASKLQIDNWSDSQAKLVKNENY